ncbi:3-ketoacyl-ACP reductase [Planococcus sp. N028]|uniref:3-ketoacyl-ACP reductase n=1 Tax=Planococcus shixiaomingii TaxID=3058393 RepID=A0ABT8MYT2_9BACL|nr:MULTISPECIES: 3-ketoacyl-ACP reductase [unclassified Planococcus (in: firmicutes)]MDN7240793.1 3-ketoacyl-ACP reductase [Planococcus sp. N028]WKA53043.1 3-ketoacyl-ACP reductase [Planococcus sp. N022]
MGQSLSGKVAFVTGAGRGIGCATAIALAKEGVSVGLIARTDKHLPDVVNQIKAFGGTAAYAIADVSQMDEVEQAIMHLTGALGPADILINNAGIGQHAALLDADPAEWKKVIDVNLMGVYYVTRVVLPQLIKKKGGDIINISSTSGLKGSAGSTAYSASKFGVLGLTESLSQEVRKHNIRVFGLAPSRVVTDMTIQGFLQEDNLEKFMQPEDLAEYMVSLLKLHPRIFIPSSSLWSTNPF